MCGPMLSSAWETEARKQNKIEPWMEKPVKKQIETFQKDVVEQEFATAVEEHRIEEVYWVGGEPLMYEQHWRYMQRIIELGDGPGLYARYNTNLSRIEYKGIKLYDDILAKIRDWQICASIDGTGTIGEYVRTGLNYTEWLENFKQGVSTATHRRQMRIDFTLTLPGMFEVVPIIKLARELEVDILAKVVFGFSPDIALSPLALPKSILHKWVDELLPDTHGAMHDVLQQLKSRPTFEQQWPNEYKQGLAKGKARVLQLESIRTQSTTMDEILSKRPDVYEWWNQIS